MPDNKHSDFDFDEFLLDEDVDPLQIFRKRLDEEEAQVAPSSGGFAAPAAPAAPPAPPAYESPRGNADIPEEPWDDRRESAFRQRAGALADAMSPWSDPYDDASAPQMYSSKAPVTVGETLHPDEMLVYDSELDDIDYDDEEDLPELRDYMPSASSAPGVSASAGDCCMRCLSSARASSWLSSAGCLRRMSSL